MKIRIDRNEFDVFETFYKPHGFRELPPTPTATGAQLRAASGISPTHELVRLHDPWPNDGTGIGVGVADREAVPLRDGMHFISVPPASPHGHVYG